jgi:hypothetical protein
MLWQPVMLLWKFFLFRQALHNQCGSESGGWDQVDPAPDRFPISRIPGAILYKRRSREAFADRF